MKVRITAPEYQSPKRKTKLVAGDEALLDDVEASRLIRRGYAVEVPIPPAKIKTTRTEASAPAAEKES